MERDPSEVWFLVRFHVSLWASVLKTLCNYSLAYYIVGSPFISGLAFYMFLYSFIYLSMKTVVSILKKDIVLHFFYLCTDHCQALLVSAPALILIICPEFVEDLSDIFYF